MCNGEQPGLYTWRLDGFALNMKGGMPYDDIGHVNVQHCTLPVDCNGTCPVSGQVKRLFFRKKKTTPSAVGK